MSQKNIILLFFLFIQSSLVLKAEQEVDSVWVAQMSDRIEAVERQSLLLNNWHLSAYLHFDTNWSEMSQEVDFLIRRARLRSSYSNDWGEILMQMELTNRELFVQDACLRLKLPNQRWFAITAGLCKIPFGYELGYSSRVREVAERARVTNTLFPDPRDIGVCLSLKDPNPHSFSHLQLNLGLYGGVGRTAESYQIYGEKKKDFIAQLLFQHNSRLMDMRLGASWYRGLVASKTGITYRLDDRGFVMIQEGFQNQLFQRQYFGIDFVGTNKNSWGQTKIMAEVLWGRQPGIEDYSSSNSRRGYMNQSSTDPIALYLRDFSGAYVQLSHRIKKSQHTLSARYDCYDPNRFVRGGAITTLGDIRFDTWTFAYQFEASENLRLLLNYNLTRNERTQFVGIKGDIPDDLITLRVQYGFW